MKKKLILIASLVFVICCLFAITANAECVEHTDNWAINRGAEGFLGELEALNVCPVCGTHFASEKIAPLFETYGYSYKEDMSSITQHFAVNRKALARYEELSGETVKFGAVVASEDAVADGNLIDAEGNPTANGILVADVTGRKYDVFEVKLVNIPAEAFDGRMFHSCAYVISNGIVTYLENGVETVKVVAKDVKDVKRIADNQLFDTPALDPVKVVGGARYEKQEWNDDGALKVLTIGNSFSDDGTEYLYNIAKAAGIENVVVGNLRAKSCSLATHLSNATNNTEYYMFRHWENGATRWTDYGSWESNGTYTIKAAVELEDWDYIVFQQVSDQSDEAETYNDLNNLINIVEALDPTAKFAWHMTWSTIIDDTTTTMYDNIVNAVQTKILTNPKIDVVIPTGTAIQNAKNSAVLTAIDVHRGAQNIHLSYGIGRYIAGLTFVKALTGLSIDGCVAPTADTESHTFNISDDFNGTAIECANNAIEKPYQISRSMYGMALVEYLGLNYRSFYNSTESKLFFEPITAEKLGEENLGGKYINANDAGCYYSTKMFTKDMLPVGSVIVVSSGWKYIVDGWVDKNTVSASRPAAETTEYIDIDEAWWGNDTIKAFSIAKNPWNNGFLEDDIDDEIKSIFKIYVPKSALEANEYGSAYEPQPTMPARWPEGSDVITNGLTADQIGKFVSSLAVDKTKVYEYDSDNDGVKEVYYAMTVEAMGIAKGYFNAQDPGGPKRSTSKTTFATTRLFDRTTLIDGCLLWTNNRYRPEGWVSSTNREENRNANIYKSNIIVSDDWWNTRFDNDGSWDNLGSPYNFRAFNVEKGSNDPASAIYNKFKIYVPATKVIDVQEVAIADDCIEFNIQTATVTINNSDLPTGYFAHVNEGWEFEKTVTDDVTVFTVTDGINSIADISEVKQNFKIYIQVTAK